MGMAALPPAIRSRISPPVPVDAPDTQLKLTLRGVFSCDNKEEARGIVADPKGNEESYGIGDAIPGNATLSEVYPDRVILGNESCAVTSGESSAKGVWELTVSMKPASLSRGGAVGTSQ